MEWDEAMERIGAMPAFVEAALSEASPGEWPLAPGPGEFSLVEHACHLRDLEREGHLELVAMIDEHDREHRDVIERLLDDLED